MADIRNCTACPRRCGADRTAGVGYCGGDDKIRVARAMLHMWEEPCISGKNGSGAIFFSGCQLKCRFCQNYKISAENAGKVITAERFGEIMAELESKGAHNINLVTPMHVMPLIYPILARKKIKIPLCINCGGYENTESVKSLDRIADIWIPDFKYATSETAEKYSKAADYPKIALSAVKAMVKQTGKPVFDGDLLKSGVIVRHLVIPGNYRDSIRVLDILKNDIGTENIVLSLMSQFTPYNFDEKYKELNRRISTYEYNKVLEHAQKLDFTGYMQERSSAKEEYTPEFDFSGI